MNPKGEYLGLRGAYGPEHMSTKSRYPRQGKSTPEYKSITRGIEIRPGIMLTPNATSIIVHATAGSRQQQKVMAQIWPIAISSGVYPSLRGLQEAKRDFLVANGRDRATNKHCDRCNLYYPMSHI